MFIVFDLDDTLANTDHRAHILDEEHESEEAKWNAFFAECHNDAPNIDVLNLFKMLHRAGETSYSKSPIIEIWTGRIETVRWDTVRWLAKYMPNIYHYQPMTDKNKSEDDGRVISGPPIRMRKADDFRKDTEIKGEWIEKYGKPDLVFDDRNKMVKWWREQGVTCCQVKESNF